MFFKNILLRINFILKKGKTENPQKKVGKSFFILKFYLILHKIIPIMLQHTFLNSVRAFILLLCFTLISNQTFAQGQVCDSTILSISTGVDNNGVILPNGTVDPNWQNGQGMNTTIVPNGSWGILTGSTWLGNANSAPGTTTFTFTRIVNVSGQNGNITFTSLADNYVQIFIDGNPVAQTPGLTIWGFQLPNAATFTGPITQGTHTITANVFNQSGPSGFNLSGQIVSYNFGTTTDISTGVNNGSAVPIGSADPNWAGILNTVTAANPSWNSLLGAQWLGNANTANQQNYSYTRTFTTGASATMNFQALADNYVILDLDGTPIAQTPGLSIWGFQLANIVNYTGTIVGAGTHTLTATVNNQGGPSGFILQGNVVSCGTVTVSPCNADASYTIAASTGWPTVGFISLFTPLPNTIVTHNWTFGDGTSSNLASPTHTYLGSGPFSVMHTITVQVLNASGQVVDICSATKICTVYRTFKLGITLNCSILVEARLAGNNEIISDGFYVRENLVQNEIMLMGNTNTYNLQLVSTDGRTIIKENNLIEKSHRIDISLIPAGIYFLQITQNNISKRIKIVKQ